MKMLVRRDDRGRHLRSREQLAIIGRYEIGAYLASDESGAIQLDLRESDEVDLRMSRSDFTTKQPHAARADDGDTDALGILFHGRRTA